MRYTFTQVYVDPDKCGDKTLDDATAIKAALMAQPETLDHAGALGDDYMLQAYYRENTQADIQSLFGGDFADSLVALSPEAWQGPVISGYGVHRVYVHSISEPPPPTFAAVG